MLVIRHLEQIDFFVKLEFWITTIQTPIVSKPFRYGLEFEFQQLLLKDYLIGTITSNSHVDSHGNYSLLIDLFSLSQF